MNRVPLCYGWFIPRDHWAIAIHAAFKSKAKHPPEVLPRSLRVGYEIAPREGGVWPVAVLALVDGGRLFLA